MGEAKALDKKMDKLEEIMMQLACQAVKTEMALERLSEAQKRTEEALKESEVLWNKRWGELPLR